jgi:hypothetical protein
MNGQMAQDPPAPASGSSSGGVGADGLPSAAVAVAGDEETAAGAENSEVTKEKDDKDKTAAAAEEGKEGKKSWFGLPWKSSDDDKSKKDDKAASDTSSASVAALPVGHGGASVGGNNGSVPSLDDLASGKGTNDSSGDKANSGSGGKKGTKAGPPPITPPVVDGTLRHMCAFQWRDLGDAEGGRCVCVEGVNGKGEGILRLQRQNQREVEELHTPCRTSIFMRTILLFFLIGAFFL